MAVVTLEDSSGKVYALDFQLTYMTGGVFASKNASKKNEEVEKFIRLFCRRYS